MELTEQLKFAIKDEKEAIEFYNGLLEDLENTILKMKPIRRRGELTVGGAYSTMYINRLKNILRATKKIKRDEERHKETLEDFYEMLLVWERY